MAVTLRTSGIQINNTILDVSGSAPSYPCRAWVNFNGNVNPATINGSLNVNSVTYNSVGNYTINFTTAMADEGYSWALNGQQPVASSSTGVIGRNGTAPAPSSLPISSVNAGSYSDFPLVTCMIFK